MNRILIALVTGAALITSAQAGDLGRDRSLKDAPSDRLPAPVQSEGSAEAWTRVWGGVLGGYGMTKTDVEAAEYGDFGPSEGEGDELSGTQKLFSQFFDGIGGEGFFGEAQLGVDKQFGRAVIGVYGLVALSNSKSELGGGGRDNPEFEFVSIDSASIEQGLSYGVGLRGGYAMSNKAMGYVAGGYRWTEFEFDGGDVFTDSEGKSEKWSDTLSGPFVETGLEGKMTNALGWKVFGRYTFYDDVKFSDRDDPEDNCWGELKFMPGELQLGAGLTYSLGVSASSLESLY